VRLNFISRFSAMRFMVTRYVSFLRFRPANLALIARFISSRKSRVAHFVAMASKISPAAQCVAA
jgi:hypothetical protein